MENKPSHQVKEISDSFENEGCGGLVWFGFLFGGVLIVFS